MCDRPEGAAGSKPRAVDCSLLGFLLAAAEAGSPLEAPSLGASRELVGPWLLSGSVQLLPGGAHWRAQESLPDPSQVKPTAASIWQ